MRLTFLFTFFMLLMLSCMESRKTCTKMEIIPIQENDFFVFHLENGIKNVPKTKMLNELIDSISYIPLETHKDALLSGDHHMFTKIGGDIFINESGVSRPSPIYHFDSLGRFVKQLILIGRGPNEVVMPIRYYGNEELKQINVIDIASKMVFVQTDIECKSTVTISSLQGLERVPLNDSTFVSANSLLSNEPNNTYLYFTDRTGRIIETIERNDELLNYNAGTSEGAQSPPYETYRLFADYKGDAIFHDIFNDTLYRIKNHREIKPHLVFKRGRLFPRPEDKQRPEHKRKQIYFGHVMESGDYVFLNYFYNNKKWCDVWSKRDGSLLMHIVPKNGFLICNTFLPFSLPSGNIIEIQVVHADRNNVYCVMRALDACKFLPNVKEDDNPVIVIAKLK